MHGNVYCCFCYLYYILGIRRNMGMKYLIEKTEDSFSSIANILLIIGAGGRI